MNPQRGIIKTLVTIVIAIALLIYFQKDIMNWYNKPGVKQALTGATILAKAAFSKLIGYFQHVASTTPAQ